MFSVDVVTQDVEMKSLLCVDSMRTPLDDLGISGFRDECQKAAIVSFVCQISDLLVIGNIKIITVATVRPGVFPNAVCVDNDLFRSGHEVDAITVKSGTDFLVSCPDNGHAGDVVAFAFDCFPVVYHFPFFSFFISTLIIGVIIAQCKQIDRQPQDIGENMYAHYIAQSSSVYYYCIPESVK